jgi:Enterobacterial TraT complement resistance protein
MKSLHAPLVALLAGWIVLLVVPGCSAVGRDLGSAVGSKYATPDGGITWNVPAPELDPVADSQKTVYVTVRNISDASQFDIKGALDQGLTNEGYRITRDPLRAHYRLRVSVRYFGENEAADGGHAQANALGAISGAAVGVGTGAAIEKVTGSSLAAVTGGGVAGALVGLGMANATKPREWDLIADVLLEERLPKPVEVNMVSDRQTDSGTSSGAQLAHDRTQGQYVGGSASEERRTSITVRRKTNYMPYGVRVTAWAREMSMTRDEAIPLIQARLAGAPAGLLP